MHPSWVRCRKLEKIEMIQWMLEDSDSGKDEIFHGPRLYVCQAPNAFICVSGVAPPQTPNAFVCVSPNAFICVSPNAFLCVSPNAFICVSPNALTRVSPNASTVSATELASLAYPRTFFNSLN